MSLENSVHSTLNDSNAKIRSLSMCKIDGDMIVTYAERIENQTRKENKQISLNNLIDNKTKGKLSETSLRSIKKHLHAWSYAVYEHNKSLKYYEQNQKAHLIMVTLTLSAHTDKNDRELKRELFGRMTERLKTKFNVKYYFIRYEAQKNGRIHAHIIIDKYIDKKELQDTWNKIQNRIGLIDKFEKKYKHRNPPSTHIKDITKNKQTIDYLLKYVLKMSEYRQIEGRLYGMSDKLKEIETSVYIVDNEIDVFVRNCIAHEKSRVYRGDFFTVVFLDEYIFRDFLPDALRQKEHNYYLSVFNFLYNPLKGYDNEILSAKGREKKEIQKNNELLLNELKTKSVESEAFQTLFFPNSEIETRFVNDKFRSHYD